MVINEDPKLLISEMIVPQLLFLLRRDRYRVYSTKVQVCYMSRSFIHRNHSSTLMQVVYNLRENAVER